MFIEISKIQIFRAIENANWRISVSHLVTQFNEFSCLCQRSTNLEITIRLQ